MIFSVPLRRAGVPFSSVLRPLSGTLVCVATALAFSAGNVLAVEAEDVSTFVMATYRNAVVVLLVLPLVIDRALHPFPKGEISLYKRTLATYVVY